MKNNTKKTLGVSEPELILTLLLSVIPGVNAGNYTIGENSV